MQGVLRKALGVQTVNRIFRALRHRDFRWYWASAAAQPVGMGMQFLIHSWLVLELTGSASRMGFLVFLFGITGMIVILFAGTLADRFDRRDLSSATQAFTSVVLAGLAVLQLLDRIELWHLYVSVILMAFFMAINTPARAALVPDLVDREDIMNAVVLNTAVMNAGRVLGPAIAGAVIELAGIGPSLGVAAAFFALASFALLMVRRPERAVPVERASFVSDLGMGFRYCWTNPVTFTVITIGFVFGLFGMSYVQLMPAFAKQVLGASAGQVGLLMSGAGVGALAGTIFLASLGNFRYKNWLLIASMFLFGVSLFLLAWSPWFWVSWGILLFLGLSDIFPMGTTVLQLSVSPELRGRVMSLWYVTAAFTLIGAFPMALVADFVNWTAAFAGGAVICLVIAMIVGVVRPTLRQLRV